MAPRAPSLTPQSVPHRHSCFRAPKVNTMSGELRARQADTLIPQHPNAKKLSEDSLQADAAVAFRCWKHSRQNTGRPCVGLNGTVVSRWHPEQIALVSTLCIPPPLVGKPSVWARLLLQFLQRFGSFLNCLSWKKSCSPAVKMKSAPQSTHFRTLSWNSIELPPFQTTPREPELTGLPSLNLEVDTYHGFGPTRF